MKIAIIGYSGAGKSTLAKRLGSKFNCPILYLDTVNFEPGWVERSQEEGKLIVEEFMKNESWVIDGNYKAFYQERRFEEADKIIFMNYPRRTCLRQAFMRYLRNKNISRESMANGCIEKFDFEFMKWILIDGRNKKRRDKYKNICEKYREKVVVCRNRKEKEELFK